MSDTPRTDEREARSEGLHDEWAFTLCRQLERELNAANQNQWSRGIHSCHNACARPMCVLRRERDEARKALHDLMEEYEDRARYYSDEHDWKKHEDTGIIRAINNHLIAWETSQPKL